jgi:hypothetical protein
MSPPCPDEDIRGALKSRKGSAALGAVVVGASKENRSSRALVPATDRFEVGGG